MFSAEPVCSWAAYLFADRLRDRGCSAHPVFPAPFEFQGARSSSKTSGAPRRENDVAHLSAVIPGWSEGPDPESRDSGFDATEPRQGPLPLRLDPFRRASPQRVAVFGSEEAHMADGAGAGVGGGDGDDLGLDRGKSRAQQFDRRPRRPGIVGQAQQYASRSDSSPRRPIAGTHPSAGPCRARPCPAYSRARGSAARRRNSASRRHDSAPATTSASSSRPGRRRTVRAKSRCCSAEIGRASCRERV